MTEPISDHPLRVLFAHNTYLVPGGEDVSVHEEIEMMTRAGHDADLWQVSNKAIADMNPIATGIGAVWSRPAMAELGRRLTAKSYDVLHVQNNFPLLSPAIHRVASARGVATVQHLRNFRLLCANSTFHRNGRVCLDCAHSFVPWRGVLRKCYRNSAVASLAPAAMVGAHKMLGTFSRHIDAYIAISDHVRSAHISAGFPENRIHLRYCTTRSSSGAAAHIREPLIVLPGRLTREKGVDIAIKAWRNRERVGTLHIAGTGPDEQQLRSLAAGDPSIVFEGQLPHDKIIELVGRARAVVNSTVAIEAFGRTPMEAFSVGTPAIVSQMGGLSEIVDHGRTGFVVPPGDINALDSAITKMLDNDEAHKVMCDAARNAFEERFAPTVLLPATEAIYRAAIARRRCLFEGSPTSANLKTD